MQKEIITSRQNRAIVDLLKLEKRKEREETKTFSFDGVKLLIEALRFDMEIDKIFLAESKAESITNTLLARFPKKENLIVDKSQLVSDDLFAKISTENSPEGVIVIAKYIDKFKKFATIYNTAKNDHSEINYLVLLDAVRDPGNIGTILRSAAALGATCVLMSSDCADIYNAKTVRASMGAVFSLPTVRVENLAEVVEKLQQNGTNVYAATLSEKAERLDEIKIQKGDAVIIGNEGHGISQEVLEVCQKQVYIPMTDKTESLNAGAAATILMWEFGKNK